MQEIFLRLAMNWQKSLKGKFRTREFLKEHTTFKIGGPAKIFFEPRDIKDLRLSLSLVKKNRIPILVIGAGSNILVNDDGFKGMVLRLNTPSFKKIVLKHNCLEAGSGVLLSQVVLKAKGLGLSGAEFLSGIPGTVGGALIMNAGIREKNIADLVEDVKVMDYNGNIKILNKNNIKFKYRSSNLSQYIILSARLKLRKKDPRKIKEKIKKYFVYRKLTHDLSKPSAGCVFKNPTGYSAGRLIDLCGLKGKRIGDASISFKHANFIVNIGNARAKDVLKLMSLIRREVKKKFNISLKPEIKIWK